MLETLALAVGRQVATHATRAWLGHRKNTAERTASLTDLLAIGVTDQFARRKLERQLEDIGDQVAKRITPLAREFPDLRDNERRAALDAVVDALTEADLTDALMLGADMDGAKLARSVRQRISLNPGLNESAQALYNQVLDETCVSLVSVVQYLPVFQPRALTEILGRLTHIETVLTQLPRTSVTCGPWRLALCCAHCCEARMLSQGGERVLRHMPRSLEGHSKAQAVACVRTAALVGGPEALNLLAEYATTPIGDVQLELADACRYFSAEQYAKEVLANAPLLKISVAAEMTVVGAESLGANVTIETQPSFFL